MIRPRLFHGRLSHMQLMDALVVGLLIVAPMLTPYSAYPSAINTMARFADLQINVRCAIVGVLATIT
jgi:hypothetical protein